MIKYYKSLVQELLDSNACLRAEVDTMRQINDKYEMNDEQVKQMILIEQNKRERLQQELREQKETYESKIQNILDQRVESQLGLTVFYNKKIDFLETELATSIAVRQIQEKNIGKLKGEIETLAKIVKTSRRHFKELEKADFDALQHQLEKYEAQVAELKTSESAVKEFLAEKAMKRLTTGQKKTERKEMSAEAQKHGFDPVKTPLEEKTPKVALKELIEKHRRRKIYE